MSRLYHCAGLGKEIENVRSLALLQSAIARLHQFSTERHEEVSQLTFCGQAVSRQYPAQT